MPKQFETPYLTFKYLKNHNVDLGSGEQFPIRFEIREKSTPQGPAAEPYFFMDEIRKIELQDERVLVQTRTASMTDRRYAEMMDAAYLRSAEATKRNNLIRQRCDQYAEQGVIVIVSDPFRTSLTEDNLEVVEDSDPRPEAPKPVAPKKPVAKRKKKPAKKRPVVRKAAPTELQTAAPSA